ncbi:MAG TPA: hypothetical protein VLM19_05890 [Nitrospiraceae bacterium]|nr:hypothetical protein [Nitrospiraceae bacterium]
MTTTTSRAKKQVVDCCHRCGGFMVAEFSAETGTVEWHCLTCGERVDHVILAHRQSREAQHEAEQSFAGSGHSRLN